MTARDAGAIASRVLAVFTFISAARAFIVFVDQFRTWRRLEESEPYSPILFFGGVSGLLLAFAVLLWFQAGRFWNPPARTGTPLTFGNTYRLALCLLGAYLFFSHGVSLLGTLSLLTHTSEMADLAWHNARQGTIIHMVGVLVGAGLFLWNRHAVTATAAAPALDT